MSRRNVILCRKCLTTATANNVKPLSTVATPFGLHCNKEESLTNYFASVLQTCSDSLDPQRGKKVHAQSIVNGISGNGVMGPKLLGMYVLCGQFIDAKSVFYQLHDLSCSAPWNWMVRGLNMMGWFDLALLFYLKMLGCGIFPDKYTFLQVIKTCRSLNNSATNKLVHEMIHLMDGEVDMFAASSMIKFYMENGFMVDARTLFERMPLKDCVLWNVMLNGYLKNGDTQNAAEMFLEMRKSNTKPNSITFAGILSLCASEGMISLGTQLHGIALKCGLELDSPVANTLLAMYSKCQCLYEARKLFNIVPECDIVTWNAIISGHVQNGLMNESLLLFNEMLHQGLKPDSVTFSSLLPLINDYASVKQGKAVHGYILRNGVQVDAFLKSALIDVYFKSGDIRMAYKVFDQSTVNDDVVIYTTMISGCVHNEMNVNAMDIFRLILDRNLTPNSVTVVSLLPACAGLASIKLGKELHGYVLKNGLDCRGYVMSAIADMYAKCGQLDVARQIFRSLPEKDVICWNSVITNCSQNGKPEEAIELFREMGLNGVKYDCVSISSVLSACASLPAPNYGKAIHGYMTRRPSCYDVYAESTLIDMYGKCGHLDLARHVFDMMGEKNEVSWNSMIAAYGSHGLLLECLSLFNEMLANAIEPDDVTFLAIISACGHAGQIDKGMHYFRCMTEQYRIPAAMEHYACMVDLFGRAGRLDEAFKTIKSMSFKPDAGVWGTLLGACRLHGNVDLAEVASRHLMEMEPDNSGYYVLLSNLHADMGHWSGVVNVRNMMKEKGVKKVRGRSWIDVDKTTHIFVAADGTHEQSPNIYSMLDVLLVELRKEGYVPQVYIPRHAQTKRLHIA